MHWRPLLRLASPLLAALAVLFLAWPDGSPSASEMPLPDVLRTYGLQVQSDPGEPRLRLAGAGLDLVLAPGLPMALVNGIAHTLREPPRQENGQTVLPADLIALLAARPRLIRGTIVLDAGHGGRDDGASAHGIREKDLVLDVTLRCARLLRSRGAEVVLTRSDDRFIDLADRSRVANDRPEALFVSIHANAAPGAAGASAEGIETFVLAGRITDRARAQRAARQYAIFVPGEVGMEQMPEAQARQRLEEISRRARAESGSLAQRIQSRLVRDLAETDRGVREKNLAVLREAFAGPAVLVEIGFLTHAGTARRCRDDAYRERIAAALCEGIADYLSQRR